jgi:hypothetical protein
MRVLFKYTVLLGRERGTLSFFYSLLSWDAANAEEAVMPVLLLWAVPAVIVVGGAGYWLIHMH